MSELDYSEVELPKFKDTRTFSSRLGELDYAKLRALAKVKKDSAAGLTKVALERYISENWSDCVDEIGLQASSQGMSKEQYFTILIKD